MPGIKTLLPVLAATAVTSLFANGAALAGPPPNQTRPVYTVPHLNPVPNANGGKTTYIGVQRAGDGRVVHIYEDYTKGVKTFHWIDAAPTTAITHGTATNPKGSNSSFDLNPGRP